MSISSSLAKFVAPLALFSAATALASETPDPREIYIRGVTYNGTGCPLGTVAESISADRQAVTLIFSDYIAEAGPGLTLRDGYKACQINLDLNIPSGFQYTIASFDYRGFYDLRKGTKAEYTTSYYFQGQGGTSRTSYVWDTLRGRGGDLSGFFDFNQKVGITSLVWSPCGVSRSLNVNTAMKVSQHNGYKHSEGVMGTDSIDASFRKQFAQQFYLQWRRCK